MMKNKFQYCTSILAAFLLAPSISSHAQCTVSTSAPAAARNYITRVQFANLDYSSGFSNNGYSNTGQAASVGAELNTFTITVNHVTNGQSNQKIQVWIDLDKDGVFEEGERVLSKPIGSNGVTTGTITTSLSIGQHRMRVKYSGGAAASNNPCQNGYVGEVEDYNILAFRVIHGPIQVPGGGKKSGTGVWKLADVTLYPNPTDGKVSFTGAEQISHIEVYNAMGQKVYATDAADQLDLSNFASGMYNVRLQLKDNSEQVLRVIKK